LESQSADDLHRSKGDALMVTGIPFIGSGNHRKTIAIVKGEVS